MEIIFGILLVLSIGLNEKLESEKATRIKIEKAAKKHRCKLSKCFNCTGKVDVQS